MIFLETDSGILAGHSIVLIGAERTVGRRLIHEIDYTHGQEACTTRANADDVTAFLLACEME